MTRIMTVARRAVLIGALGGLPLSGLPARAQERRDAMFLYFHIPFCEQRCGFCNLFTQPVPQDDRVEAYLATLARQASVVRRALDEGGDFAIARAAIGGGTPTLLDAKQLERLLGEGAKNPGAEQVKDLEKDVKRKVLPEGRPID